MARIEIDEFIGMWDSSRDPKSAHQNIENERNIHLLENILSEYGQKILPEHRQYLKAFGTGTGPMFEGISMRTIALIKSYKMTDGRLPDDMQLVGVSTDEPYMDLYLIHEDDLPYQLAYIPTCIGDDFKKIQKDKAVPIAENLSSHLYIDFLRREIHDAEWRALLASEATQDNIFPEIEDALREVDVPIDLTDFLHSTASTETSDGQETIIAEAFSDGFRVMIGCQDQQRITKIIQKLLMLERFELILPRPRANDRPYRTRGTFTHNFGSDAYELVLKANPNLGSTGPG